MNNKHILIVEDQIPHARQLENQLLELGYETVTHCRNDVEVMNCLREINFDLALVDIGLEHSNLNGLALAKEIKTLQDIPVIFITSFSDKSNVSNASELSASNYLVKPVSTRQLFVSLSQTFQQKAELQIQTTSGCPFVATKDWIYVKGKDESERVNINDLLYLQAEKGYTRLVTHQKEYVTPTSLVNVLKQFPHPHLARVHRSYVVNIHKVAKRTSSGLTLVNRKSIPFSRSYRHVVEKHFSVIHAD